MRCEGSSNVVDSVLLRGVIANSLNLEAAKAPREKG